MSAPPNEESEEDSYEEYYDDYEEPQIIPEVEDAVDSNGQLINQQPMYDRIINVEVQMQHGNKLSTRKVVHCALGPDGKTTGSYANNPILNSIVYEVEFPDGQTKEYAANTIAENMLSQINSDGYSMALIQGIIDFKKDDATAVPKSDKWLVTASRHLSVWKLF
jgi:hypothetical protein